MALLDRYTRLADDPQMPTLERRERAEMRQMEVQICQEDPWYWMSNYFWTLNEHDDRNPILPFPVELPYTRPLCELWYTNPHRKLVVGKSRQVLATWEFAGLHLWDTQFHTGRKGVFQSQTEDHAKELVRRAKFILEQQPTWLTPEFTPQILEVEFPRMRSHLFSIPSGEGKIRTFVPSTYLMDEAGFQPAAEECYSAAIPCIQGGGRITVVSTANPGFFEDLFKGRLNRDGRRSER